MKMDDYITVAEAAEKWDVSLRQVQLICKGGKIPGAIRFANAWAIPKDAPKPTITRKTKPGPKKKIS
jgi:hypothetical protein